MSKMGFIGFGEAAYNIASGLKSDGYEIIAAYDKFWDVEPQCDLIGKRAKEIGVNLFPSLKELVENSDIILSAVSADKAVPLALDKSSSTRNDVSIPICVASVISRLRRHLRDNKPMGPISRPSPPSVPNKTGKLR